jgi:hypothetical protein
VIGIGATEELRALRLALELPVGQKRLDRRLVRAGARIREQRVRQARQAQRVQLLRKQDRRLVVELKNEG